MTQQNDSREDQGPRVYISADLEGVSGVVHVAELVRGNKEHEEARALFVGEVNAAVEGALDAGAREVIVSDGHSYQRNIGAAALHEAATLVRGRPRPLGQLAGLERGFDALLLVGYHARKGVERAVLDHTMLTRTVDSVVVNDVELGEIGLNAALAGDLDVPLVFVSGDRAAVVEARELVGDVVGVSVKEGLGRNAAASIHPKRARARIRAGVREAIERRAEIPPYVVRGPVHARVTFTNTAMADTAAFMPSATRLDGRTLAFDTDDYTMAWRAIRAATLLASLTGGSS